MKNFIMLISLAVLSIYLNANASPIIIDSPDRIKQNPALIELLHSKGIQLNKVKKVEIIHGSNGSSTIKITDVKFNKKEVICEPPDTCP